MFQLCPFRSIESPIAETSKNHLRLNVGRFEFLLVIIISKMTLLWKWRKSMPYLSNFVLHIYLDSILISTGGVQTPEDVNAFGVSDVGCRKKLCFSCTFCYKIVAFVVQMQMTSLVLSA